MTDHLGPRPSRVLALLSSLAIAGSLVAGCAPGVPDWARHVQPMPASTAAVTEDVAARVIYELSYDNLGHRHIAPEQMAIVAVRELERGRLVDAGLWLSLASYRYHQEAIEAYVQGEAGAGAVPYGVSMRAYRDLVIAEVKRFAQLDFDDEMRTIAARLRGGDEKEAALEDQLAALGKTDAGDREALRDVWAQVATKHGAATEDVHYDGLASAFRARLLRDAKVDPEDRNPSVHLAFTPLVDFKKDALGAAAAYFQPPLCEGVALAFPALRPTTLAALSASRPETRANAAAALGLAPTDETRPVLQARLAVEKDPRVKLALAFALVHHGATEQLLPLTTALQSCRAADCELPELLIQWLPPERKLEVPQAPFARIVADKKMPRRPRLVAAAFLRSIAGATALAPETVEALVLAARFKIDDAENLQIWASEAVQRTTTLSRDAVLARMDQPYNATTIAMQDYIHPCALLARLAAVALPDDLPTLKRLMSRYGYSDSAEPTFIVAAALNVRNASADALLMDWFARYKRLQPQIAFGLLARESVPRDKLRQLVWGGGARAQLIVKLLLHDDDAAAVLNRFLINGDVGEKFDAAELAGLAARPEARQALTPLLEFFDARYYPNDALLRHAATQALVRLALAGSRPGAPTSAPEAQ
jgi:hypothetical protein